MKKMFLFLVMVLCPLVVNAECKVSDHLIDSEIEIAGGLRVKELVVVDGQCDFFSRTVNYYSFGSSKWDGSANLDNSSIYNGDGIVNVKASSFLVNGKIDFNTFGDDIKYYDELTPKKKDGNLYSVTNNNDGTSTIKIFNKVNNKKTAFYYEYLVSNIVVKHNDIKEINYSFKNLNFNSSNTLVRMIIPYATSDSEYNVWVHGNKSGKVQEIIDSSDKKMGIIGSFSTIKDEVNIRMTLPNDQIGIDVYLRKSNIDALDKIIELEDDKLDKTNSSKKIVSVMKYILIFLGGIYAISSILLLKNKDISLFYVYLAFGVFLSLFNYLFRYNYWYLYVLIVFPIIFKVISKYVKKSK